MDSLITLFLLPSFAGYFVLTRSPIYSISITRHPVPLIFVESFAVGLFLLYLSYALFGIFSQDALNKNLEAISQQGVRGAVEVVWQTIKIPLIEEISKEKNQITPQSIFSILISVFYVIYCKIGLMLQSNRLSDAVMAARDDVGGTTERMFVHAMNTLTPIQITLKNRKVYVGLVQNLPNLDPDNKHQKFINIIPLKSGYRDDKTLEINAKMVDYSFLMQLLVKNAEKKQPSDEIQINLAKGQKTYVEAQLVYDTVSLGMMIDFDEVMSIALWDAGIFKKFIHEQEKIVSNKK